MLPSQKDLISGSKKRHQDRPALLSPEERVRIRNHFADHIKIKKVSRYCHLMLLGDPGTFNSAFAQLLLVNRQGPAIGGILQDFFWHIHSALQLFHVTFSSRIRYIGALCIYVHCTILSKILFSK